MTDIVISEFMDEQSVHEGFANRDFVYDSTLVDDTAALYAQLGSARALIVRNRTQVNASLLEKAPNLIVVGRLGVGLDNIDLDACKARGITVCPATGANDLSVAEYVITAALSLLRGAYSSSDNVAAGHWPRSQLIGQEICGKTLGLVGYGNIARETARRARALGMEVIAYDPFLPSDDPHWTQTGNVSLKTLYARADIVSLHTPLTDQTKHMINAAAIKAMKPGTIVINAARGGIVDENALCEGLRSGHLGGAALDVFENEPLSANDGNKFQGLSNFILTPHIAGVTKESNIRVSQLTVENVLKYLTA